MKILITNYVIWGNSGTEMYVKELAIELLKRGHSVEVYTLIVGNLAKELIEKNIYVTNDINTLKNVPDIIHAHHNIVVSKVAFHFKKTPIIFFIHDRKATYDYPFFHKNIIEYLAVDFNCRERYLETKKIQEDEVKVIYNWVNTERFKLKPVINATPTKALIFSNYISKEKIYTEIKAACEAVNIELEIMGNKSGNPCEKPEQVIQNYDIIFGKAKAGMEAMATGAALIVCDYTGLGEMITSENMEYCRKYNYGMKLMTRSADKSLLIDEIKKYDRSEVEKVTNYIRSEANLISIVNQLEETYRLAIANFKAGKRGKHSYTIFNHLYIIAINFKALKYAYYEKYKDSDVYKAVRKIYRLFKFKLA